MKLVNLKSVMRGKKVKSVDIAAALNVSEKTVSEWLNGKTFPNDKSLLYLLCKLGELKAESDTGEIINLVPANPTRPPATESSVASVAGAVA